MEFVFFFQAEDGIRDADVTGVQTCALPICSTAASSKPEDATRVGSPCAPVCRSSPRVDRKSTRLNSRHVRISYAVFCLKKKKKLYFPYVTVLEKQIRSNN